MKTMINEKGGANYADVSILDKVYDESEYSHCPYCSGELDDDEEVRPCPECGGCLHWDGDIWECSNCDYTEED